MYKRETKVSTYDSYGRLYLEGMDILNDLTGSEIKLFFKLVRKVKYGTGMINLNSTRKAVYANEFGMALTTFNNMFYKLVKVDLLFSIGKRTGYYYINPFVWWSGDEYSRKQLLTELDENKAMEDKLNDITNPTKL